MKYVINIHRENWRTTKCPLDDSTDDRTECSKSSINAHYLFTRCQIRGKSSKRWIHDTVPVNIRRDCTMGSPVNGFRHIKEECYHGFSFVGST